MEDKENLEKEEEKIKIIKQNPILFPKIIEILKYNYICKECLGRQFSYLGTLTTNTKRADSILLTLMMECHRLIRENKVRKKFTLYNYDPLDILYLIANRTHNYSAEKILRDYFQKNKKKPDRNFEYLKRSNILKKPFKCNLCKNLLNQSNTKKIAKKINQEIKKYDFKTFLLGTRLNSSLEEREDEFRARYQIKNGESFRKNLNRTVGKKIDNKLKSKEVEFEKPDLTIIMDIKEPNVQKIELEILPQSLYIKGRYFKNARNLPQTKWHCRHCWGRGHTRNGEECEECGGTGRTYPSSIEDKFEKVFLKYTDGTRGVLHAAGREDVDARCLGNGRPFLMEIKKPKKRYINLPKIEREINKENDGKVMAIGLKFGKKQYIVNLKKRSNIDRKKYQALVFLNKTIDKSYFQKKMEKAKNKIVGSEIHQRTPLRVVHRRVDKVRNKRIYDLKGKFIDPVHVSFIIETQGGTYIKEFISGDKYRTKPSLSELFGIKMKCVELDVIYIL